MNRAQQTALVKLCAQIAGAVAAVESDLLVPLHSLDPLQSLARLRVVEDQVQALRIALVARARESASWGEVAAALGVTRQAAHARYRDTS